eukprot:6381318-Pyramimonas_sp.AAC.1
MNRHHVGAMGNGVENETSNNLVVDVRGIFLTTCEPCGHFRKPQGRTSGARTRVEEETTRRLVSTPVRGVTG